MDQSLTNMLQLRGVDPGLIRSLLTRASAYMDGAVSPQEALRGKSVALVFEENSTRTRGSFTAAANRLGLGVIDLSSGTSLSKGESIADTARTVAAMGADAMVIRSSRGGAAHVAAQAVGIPVINAGDGRHEHPTQGLLDALAFARSAEPDSDRRLRFDFKGVTLAVVGDVASSRVARSDAACFRALGGDVVLVGPPGLAPGSLEALGARVERDFERVLCEADAVQMLRVQFERHGGRGVPSKRAYRAGYALTAERALMMKPGAVVMHPGPMNRGLEIDGPVADSDGSEKLPRSLILDQVACGVGVRMAVLEALLAPNGCGSGEAGRASECVVVGDRS